MLEIHKFLNNYGIGVTQGVCPNQIKTRPRCFNFTDEDIQVFNDIYTYVKNYHSPLNTMIRTKSGGIAKCQKNLYAWDCLQYKSGIRMTICLDGVTWVFKVGAISKAKDDFVAPIQAWLTFIGICEENGIDINSYAINPNVAELIKEKIDKPLIYFNEYQTATDEPLENVHHLDFHNSYPAGLVNTHPEFRPVVEPLYLKRKQDPKYKAILNYTIGAMQSLKTPWKAKWAHLAKDAIHDNTLRVRAIEQDLINSGHKIIGFNTDGIWYQGDIYHGPGEGKNLGEWENDHVNCKFRAKSKGAYEFIEDGIYHPVIRGSSDLDLLCPDRDKWVWGDIYRATMLIYEFDEERGIIHYEERREEN